MNMKEANKTQMKKQEQKQGQNQEQKQEEPVKMWDKKTERIFEEWTHARTNKHFVETLKYLKELNEMTL